MKVFNYQSYHAYRRASKMLAWFLGFVVGLAILGTVLSIFSQQGAGLIEVSLLLGFCYVLLFYWVKRKGVQKYTMNK